MKCQGGEADNLNRMGRAGFLEKETPEPNPEGGKGVSYVGMWGRVVYEQGTASAKAQKSEHAWCV